MSDTTATWPASDTSGTPGAAAPTPATVRSVTADPRADDLAARVWLALRVLANPTRATPAVSSGRLERRLRAAIELRPTGTETPATEATINRAAAAIRVACAHLVARNPREAHFALLTAQALLPRPRPRGAVMSPSVGGGGVARVVERERAVS